jgi:hypothetical protein
MSIRPLAALSALLLLPLAAQAQTFASTTGSFIRGSVPADFAGFYGGTFPGAFPVALSEAQARASVLNAPDGQFLSLPGVSSTPSGSPFPGAYVEVGFGGDFLPTGELLLWELGNNAESAHLFLWSDNGGNIQLNVTRSISDVISVDLSSYAGVLAAIGGSAFSRVGIGGIDVLGTSQGFDLDAVAITSVPIPEPSTYALMLASLGVVGWFARRRRALR